VGGICGEEETDFASFQLTLVVEHVIYLAKDRDILCEEFLDGYVQALRAHQEQLRSAIRVQMAHKWVD
jgi:hypothetical protein